MVKKKNPTLATSAVSSGAAAKAPPNPSRRSASDAPPPAPAPPAPSSSTAGPIPADWPASTKRDEKRARRLGIISSDEGNIILPKAADIPAEVLDKLPNNSKANALSLTLESHKLVQDLLQKGKGAMARMHSMIFPKIDQNKTLGQLVDAFAINTKEVIEVSPVPSFTNDSSGACSENDRLQRMKDRISQMEKDMCSTYALATIIRKKNELVVDAERYALVELHRATESLNFIALNPAEDNKRIHERVNALAQLSSLDEVFWKDQSKASTVAKFQDQIQQVHRFFDKCYKGLRII
ncbi:hypothetical protein QYE76_035875 [Lolium multiflorum]|uniref:Uncharacterized protein n=1 Tax=Lolium multiflorum TaxID=4521 RepID=A0AAD8R0Z4_LOLMU|nr:hypothetical protein QYE76_035875 [Lolium multiflorum]